MPPAARPSVLSASIIACPASRPPPSLSVATWVAIATPGSLQGMSTVKTGMPAALASRITGTIDFESQGESTMAAAFLTMKSLIWLPWRATSLSALTTVAWKPCFTASAVIASPITLKNGLSSASSETQIVPRDAAVCFGVSADPPQPRNSPQQASMTQALSRIDEIMGRSLLSAIVRLAENEPMPHRHGHGRS